MRIPRSLSVIARHLRFPVAPTSQDVHLGTDPFSTAHVGWPRKCLDCVYFHWPRGTDPGSIVHASGYSCFVAGWILYCAFFFGILWHGCPRGATIEKTPPPLDCRNPIAQPRGCIAQRKLTMPPGEEQTCFDVGVVALRVRRTCQGLDVDLRSTCWFLPSSGHDIFVMAWTSCSI